MPEPESAGYRIPDDEPVMIESERIFNHLPGSLLWNGEIPPSNSDPDIFQQHGNQCQQVPDGWTFGRGSSSYRVPHSVRGFYSESFFIGLCDLIRLPGNIIYHIPNT